jgi:hypothetical protein
MIEHLQAELSAASAALREHMASWEYAFAMAGGCHGGANHPALRETRATTGRLEQRYRDLRARLAEHLV